MVNQRPCARPARRHGASTSTPCLLALFLFATTALLAGCGAEPVVTGAAARPADHALAAARESILAHVRDADLSPDEVRDWIGFAEEIKTNAKEELSLTGRVKRALRNPWVAFGFFAQVTFMMRFVLQIIASERKKRSYVPIAFWYLSLAGGLMLFVYALERRDPVFVFGQGLGIFIYARNLILIYRRQDTLRDRLGERRQRNHVAAAGEGTDSP